MSDEFITGLLIAAAFAFLAWPHLRRALGLGPGITPDKLKARLERGDPTLIVDVRSKEEVANGSLPGAIHIPLTELTSRVPELSVGISERPETGVVLVCQSGMRAERALVILAGAGISKVTVLKGGVTAWRKAGFESLKISTL
jgi:rhodanese-related sulfurtransferase